MMCMSKGIREECPFLLFWREVVTICQGGECLGGVIDVASNTEALHVVLMVRCLLKQMNRESKCI